MLPVVHGFEVTKRQIIVWVACLLPLPFFLGSLGLPIVILGTLLNVGWLVRTSHPTFSKVPRMTIGRPRLPRKNGSGSRHATQTIICLFVTSKPCTTGSIGIFAAL